MGAHFTSQTISKNDQPTEATTTGLVDQPSDDLPIPTYTPNYTGVAIDDDDVIPFKVHLNKQLQKITDLQATQQETSHFTPGQRYDYTLPTLRCGSANQSNDDLPIVDTSITTDDDDDMPLTSLQVQLKKRLQKIEDMQAAPQQEIPLGQRYKREGRKKYPPPIPLARGRSFTLPRNYKASDNADNADNELQKKLKKWRKMADD